MPVSKQISVPLVPQEKGKQWSKDLDACWEVGMAWGRRAYVVFSRNLKPNIFCKDRNLTLQSETSFQERKEERGHLQYEESERRERKKKQNRT